MFLDIYETGIGTYHVIPARLDKGVHGVKRRDVGGFPGTTGKAPELAVCTGARLIQCKPWLGATSWKEATGTAAHGGRTTLEYQKLHPHEEDSIQVVFSSY